MYNGKYHNKKSRLGWSKQFVLLASVIVLLAGAIGGSLAYLFTNSNAVVNTFTPGEVNITVEETFNDNIKSNVMIKNTGNVDAKIRAMIVVTWQDKQGNIYPAAPVQGVDYFISDLPGSGWSGSGSWYVYSEAVPSVDDPNTVQDETCTGYLFTSCEPVVGKTPKGYHLVVDVIAEAIQAEGGASF